jgi:hypothetical protein
MEALVKARTGNLTRLDTFLGWVGLLLIGIIGWTLDRFGGRADVEWGRRTLSHTARRT